MEKMKVVVYGVGPIGAKMLQYLSERDSFEIAGAVDIAPEKVGRDISEIAPLGAKTGIIIRNDPKCLLEEVRPDAVVLTTTSILEKIKPQILEITGCGVNVVSTCEELSYPWETNPVVAKEIDDSARANGVSVLGTGVNPGFLMDFLPIAMTGVCRSVESVFVERIQDASQRRIPFQQKVGVGIGTDEFKRRAEQGVLRHVGLAESIYMVASRMGWKLDRTDDIVEPVIAEEDISVNGNFIEKGYVLGVKQTGYGYVGGKALITLVFIAAAGVELQYDRVFIKGTPPIDMTIKNGVNGDIATCAMTMNAVPVVIKARPGLRTMADIEPVACFS